MLAVSFLAGVGLALVVSYLADPVYQAEATIMVTRGQASGGLAALSFGSFAERTTAINNQVEILGSRTLATQVLGRLRADAGHELFRLFTDSEEGASADALVKSLRENVEVSPMKDADFIVLRARGGSPREARTIANSYLDEYLDYSRLAARGEVGEVKTFLKGQLDAVEERLRTAEDALREYQKEHKVVGLPEETTALVEQISEFEGLLNQAKTEHGMNRARLDYLKRQLREQMATLPEDIAQVSSPVIQELRGTLSQLEAARSQLLTSGYAPEHPEDGRGAGADRGREGATHPDDPRGRGDAPCAPGPALVLAGSRRPDSRARGRGREQLRARGGARQGHGRLLGEVLAPPERDARAGAPRARQAREREHLHDAPRDIRGGANRRGPRARRGRA